MTQCRPAVHHTILVIDVEKFTAADRTNLDQLAVRKAVYAALKRAFLKAGIDWDACRVEDRGDGAFVLIPSDVPKMLLATKVLTSLAAALRRHNRNCRPGCRVRLRAALHAGEVHYDAHGVTSKAINFTFRMAEAPALKSALAESSGELVLMVSDWFYDEVVQHYPEAKPSSFQRARATVKETDTTAWIRLVDNRVSASSTIGTHTMGEDGSQVPLPLVPDLASTEIVDFVRRRGRLAARDAS